MDFSANKTPAEVIILDYFRYWLGRRFSNDERKINRWKAAVSRFKGKLVRMKRDVGDKLDDYLISPKIRKFYCIGVMN